MSTYRNVRTGERNRHPLRPDAQGSHPRHTAAGHLDLDRPARTLHHNAPAPVSSSRFGHDSAEPAG